MAAFRTCYCLSSSPSTAPAPSSKRAEVNELSWPDLIGPPSRRASARRMSLIPVRMFGHRPLHNALRPADQCRAPGLGQRIDSPFDADKPAIDIVQQDFRRLRGGCLDVARAAGAIG